MSEILVFILKISIPSYNLPNLLCSGVENNPGPNLHKMQTFKDYEKRNANANFYPCFVYTKY